MTRPTDTRLDFRFDRRVVGSYDALRGHPPEIRPAIAAHLAGLVAPGGRLLEIGIGTGRMALPLAAEELEVIGVDRSLDMLAALRAAQSTDAPWIGLVQADAEALPFADTRFDAVLCVHVLHLLNDARAALSQALALLRPGGCLILGRDWIDPESFAGIIRNQFRMAVVELGDNVRFPAGARAFLTSAIEHGAEPYADGEEQVAAEWQTELTPRQVLDGIRSRDDAESWVLPDDLLNRVMARLDVQAAEQWPDLDAPSPVRRRFVYSLLHKAS